MVFDTHNKQYNITSNYNIIKNPVFFPFLSLLSQISAKK